MTYSHPDMDLRPFGLVLDLETTGVDAWGDRIVTAYVAVIDIDGEVIQEKHYLVNPGIPIPEGASVVHGVTDEVAATGQDPQVAVGDIASIIQLECANNDLPLIGANISYDLTMLLAEARRHLSPESASAVESLLRSVNVLDSLVIDKALDKYRKGNRQLVTTAAHYGIELTDEDAHSASFDALAAGRIVLAIMRKYPQVSTLGTPPSVNNAILHEKQQIWRREQQSSLQAWFRSSKAGDRQDPNIVIDGSWPIQIAAA